MTDHIKNKSIDDVIVLVKAWIVTQRRIEPGNLHITIPMWAVERLINEIERRIEKHELYSE